MLLHQLQESLILFVATIDKSLNVHTDSLIPCAHRGSASDRLRIVQKFVKEEVQR
jgi:hypothetical protein